MPPPPPPGAQEVTIPSKVSHVVEDEAGNDTIKMSFDPPVNKASTLFKDVCFAYAYGLDMA
jgi:hypothetical protein